MLQHLLSSRLMGLPTRRASAFLLVSDAEALTLAQHCFLGEIGELASCVKV